jgi:hypothetical protein
MSLGAMVIYRDAALAKLQSSSKSNLKGKQLFGATNPTIGLRKP